MDNFTYLRTKWVQVTFSSLLCLSSIIILIWNEGRSVHNHLALDEAFQNVISINPNDPIRPVYENKFVHIYGPLETGEPLTEPDYNIQILGVKLKRRVQMYQWIEDTVERNFGESIDTFYAGELNYYYSKDWKDYLIDSSTFYIRTNHENPKKIPLESQIIIADHVNIGNYELGGVAKSEVKNFIELTSDNRPDDPSIKLHSGLYYHSDDIWNPEVGDLRIQFSYAGLETDLYTVIGKLQHGKIVPFKTSHGTNLLFIYPGEHTLSATFKFAYQTHRLITWGFRFIGFVITWFAVTSSASILNYLFSQSRILRHLAPYVNGRSSGLLVLSLSMALIIISVAWTIYRPLLGIGIIVAAISPYILLFARGIVHYQRVSP